MSSWKTSKGKSLKGEDWGKIALATAAAAAAAYTGGASLAALGGMGAAGAGTAAAGTGAAALGTEAALGAAAGAGGTAAGTAGLFGAAPGLGASALGAETALTAGGGLAGLGGAGAATPMFTAGSVAPEVLAAMPQGAGLFSAGGTVANAFGPAAGSSDAALAAALQGPGAAQPAGLFESMAAKVTPKSTMRGLSNMNTVMKSGQPPPAPQAPPTPRPPSQNDPSASFAKITGLDEPRPGDPDYEEYMRRKYGRGNA